MMYRNVKVPVYGDCYRISTDGVVVNSRTGKTLKHHINKYRRNTETVTLCVDGVSKRFYVHYLVAVTYPEICGEWFEGCEVDHINGDCTDNRAENLRFVSHGDNCRNPNTAFKQVEYARLDTTRKAKSERMKGENNPAKHYTDEWRHHLSEAQKGRVQSDDTKEKCRQAMIGRYLGSKSPNAKGVKRFRGDYAKEYGCMREAQRETGIGRESIKNCITKGRLDREGYRWAFI